MLARYKEYRKQGLPADRALEAARTHEDFDALEEKGLVRLRFIVDTEPYDDSYVDTWGLPEGRAKHEKERIQINIRRDGIYCLVGEYRLDRESDWTVGDSIGGLIGTDDGGYGPDIMANTIHNMKLALDRVCRAFSFA